MEENRPHISVIIPTYKPQDYTHICMESLAKQSMGKDQWELIMVLNGEQEPYLAQVQAWAKELGLSNLNLITTTQAGVSNARNMGIDAAQGEYITFVDDDDYVSPLYLEELYHTADSETVAVSDSSAFREVTERLPRYSLHEEHQIHPKHTPLAIGAARHNMAGPCMKLIHRTIIGDRRFDTRFASGEDSLFIMAISDRIRHIAFSNEQAVYYRRVREGSANFKHQSIRARIGNSWRLCMAYSKVYWSHCSDYSFTFYMTRILGSIWSIIKR